MLVVDGYAAYGTAAKNSPGCRSVRGTEVAAVLYTFLESTKLARVEPRSYLRVAGTSCSHESSTPLLPHLHCKRTRPS